MGENQACDTSHIMALPGCASNHKRWVTCVTARIAKQRANNRWCIVCAPLPAAPAQERPRRPHPTTALPRAHLEEVDMNSLIRLRHRGVLWGTAIAACLLSGFILITDKARVRAPKGQPGNLASTASSADLVSKSAAVPLAQGLQSNPAANPNPESRIPNPGSRSTAQPRVAESYGKLPLSFEINKGQTDSQVKFLSRGSGYSLFLTGNEAVLSLRKPGQRANGKRQMAKGKSGFQHSPFDAPRSLLERPASFQFPVSNFQTPAADNGPRTTDAVLRMRLVGANTGPRVSGLEELLGKSNYF